MASNAVLTRLMVVGAAFALLASAGATVTRSRARVTQILRDVRVLPEQAEPRPAALNDSVAEGEAIRTGDASRSELTFPDLTIVRLGANTIFSFHREGRDARLTNGSMLLQTPAGSGARNIRTDPVTVAITGTTVIFEHIRGGASRLVVLEGAARLVLARVPGQSRDLVGGQMLEVPPRARTLGAPVEVNLNDLMRTHPLVSNMRSLPSRDRIARASREQANRVGGPGARPGGQQTARSAGPAPGGAPTAGAPGGAGGAGPGPGPGR